MRVPWRSAGWQEDPGLNLGGSGAQLSLESPTSGKEPEMDKGSGRAGWGIPTPEQVRVGGWQVPTVGQP